MVAKVSQECPNKTHIFFSDGIIEVRVGADRASYALFFFDMVRPNTLVYKIKIQIHIRALRFNAMSTRKSGDGDLYPKNGRSMSFDKAEGLQDG